MKKNAAKSMTLHGHVFNFIYDNTRLGIFKDMFTQFEDEEQSKLNASLYDVLGLYLQVYENLGVRVNDMMNTAEN